MRFFDIHAMDSLRIRVFNIYLGFRIAVNMFTELKMIQERMKDKIQSKVNTKAAGIIGQVMVLAVVIILSVLLAVVIYMFINIGTTVGNLNSAQKGNVSAIANSSAQTLNFLPLLALVIIVGIIISVLLGIFVVRGR